MTVCLFAHIFFKKSVPTSILVSVLNLNIFYAKTKCLPDMFLAYFPYNRFASSLVWDNKIQKIFT